MPRAKGEACARTNAITVPRLIKSNSRYVYDRTTNYLVQWEPAVMSANIFKSDTRVFISAAVFL